MIHVSEEYIIYQANVYNPKYSYHVPTNEGIHCEIIHLMQFHAFLAECNASVWMLP